MSGWRIHPAVERAVARLADDLTSTFSGRLTSVVLYGSWVISPDAQDAPAQDVPVSSLALITKLQFADLVACAERAASWDAARLATPLVLTEQEFASSLDAFPLEFGDIIARHVAVTGRDPFAGLQVREEDVRRACEVQAKSHLVHLREGFLESGGQPAAVDRLIRQSIPSFSTLLSNLARLERLPASTSRDLAAFAAAKLEVSAALVERVLGLTRPLAGDEALQLYAPYHDATAAIATHADRWKAPARV